MLEKWLVTVGAVTLSFVWGAGFVWAQGGFTQPTDTSVVSQETAATLPAGPHGYGNATPKPTPAPAPIKLKPKPSKTPEPLRQLPAGSAPVQSSTDLSAAGTLAETADTADTTGTAAVTGPDGPDLVGLGEVVQPVEGVEVGAELPIGVRHDSGAATEHRVAGQHRGLGREHEGQGVGGVPGRRDDPDLQPVDLDDVAVVETLLPKPVRRIKGPDAAAQPRREVLRRLGVVEVVMGQEYDAHVAGLLGDRVEVGLLGRTGVDHHRAPGTGLAQDPGVGAVEGHHVGVRREHAPSSLAERATGPAHALLSRRVSKRGGTERVHPSGFS